MSCETTCVSHGARAHSYFLRSWHHLTSVGGPYHMALRPVKCLGLNFKLVKYRNRGEMSWHILPELGSFLSKTHFWTHMRSVCVYQVYQCTYSYIYLICTHVHTPHEFSRPKHPDKGFFKLGHKIHPPQNLDYTEITRIPRCPVLLLGLHQIPGVFRPKKVMTWSMKKMWRPSLRKKKNSTQKW